MWQLDGTERDLADGTTVHILRVQDDHSRMLLATLVAAGESGHTAQQVLQRAIERHGRPAALLHDGSLAFSAVRSARYLITDLQWWLAWLGVHQIVSSP